MAAKDALNDTIHSAVQTDQKFGYIRRVYITAAIGATGAITVTAAGTSDGITVTRTSTGLYAVANLPTLTAKRVLAASGAIVNDDTSPTADDARTVSWGPISLSAGTASILTTATDDGDVADPTSGTTLQAWLDLSIGT